jgi:hypothetical protein
VFDSDATVYTLALPIVGWTEWGLVYPLGYQPE